MNRNYHISIGNPADDPSLGIILHGYGCGYIELPKGFHILNKIPDCSIANTTEAIMFRCTTQPVQINIGAFPIHEFKKDLIWDNKTSFLVDQNRYKLMTEVTCKGSGVYIFYGIQNVEKSD